MENTEVQQACQLLMQGVPEQVLDLMSGVQLFICQTPAEAAEKFKTAIPNDCKGVFLGEPVQFDDPDGEQEEAEMVITAPANGVIAVIAGNLQGREEVVAVLLHEMGHALDMSEEEVEQLGLGVQQAVTEHQKVREPNEAQPVQTEAAGQ